MQHATTQYEEDLTRVTSVTARGSNQSGMRAYNERLVLSLIRQSGALAKADIARMTGLSAQTVSVIMRSLEADGLLEKGEPVRGKVGQPSVPMRLNREGAFFLGLKVGRRSLDLVLTDFLGQVVDRVQEKHAYPAPDRVVEFAHKAIGQILDRLPPEHRNRVAGLGIAMPFQLWDWAEALSVAPSEMAGWRDFDIAATIRERFDFPVYLSNDASAACGAELVFGDQTKPRDFLFFFIGFFVGGGLVLDNMLYTGRTGNAAALGSVPIRITGTTTKQLVDVASLAALEKTVLVHGGESNSLWDDPESWSVAEETLNSWTEEAANGLACAALSSACLIDFECVVVDGWMPARVRADLVERVQQRIDAIALPGVQAPQIRAGSIGGDARALGAASLPLSERFLVDRNAFLKG
ncbi:ROK family transcriptional regulator [Ruegeria marisrubri]|uniref:ROK family transcriptional regulator n=1 Tax=Ruegeria marisrubri TaxID=1685379 RepID=A0A0X3TMA6_9RHOB|nr:ROK family transcriptional regulator [Ruegeria marisrubri]KUJ76902.1 ROK family transcriptional regulator [Ruegeria marisrubri]